MKALTFVRAFLLLKTKQKLTCVLFFDILVRYSITLVLVVDRFILMQKWGGIHLCRHKRSRASSTASSSSARRTRRSRRNSWQVSRHSLHSLISSLSIRISCRRRASRRRRPSPRPSGLRRSRRWSWAYSPITRSHSHRAWASMRSLPTTSAARSAFTGRSHSVPSSSRASCS